MSKLSLAFCASSSPAAFVCFSALLAGSAGCDYAIEGEKRLTSLRVLLSSPKMNELGTPTNPQVVKTLVFDVEALDEHGLLQPVTTPVDTFLETGGTRLSLVDPCATTPSSTDQPWLLSRLMLKDGRVLGTTLNLSSPAIFGRLTLNLEEPQSQAVGATAPIYFPNPTIPLLMKPLNVDAQNASYCSPYLNRQVVVDHGTDQVDKPGKVVVSSLFQNALAVSDTGATDYGSMYVFTFSQPSNKLKVGTVLTRLSGAVAKFNGMTQIANPTLTPSDEVRTDLVPAPVLLDKMRLPDNGTTNQPNNKWLTKYIAAPAKITGIVCEVVSDQNRKDNWAKYNTVVINLVDNDPASVAGCSPGSSFSFKYFSVQLPGKGFAGFDPALLAGTEATFVGMLQNGASKSGKTLFWTVVVRDAGDVCLLPKAQCQI